MEEQIVGSGNLKIREHLRVEQKRGQAITELADPDSFLNCYVGRIAGEMVERCNAKRRSRVAGIG